MFVYSKVLKELAKACTQYRKQNLALIDLKEKIWLAAQSIVSVEERELREFLQQSEAELDSIQFTVDESDVFNTTLRIVERIEQKLSEDSNS